MEGWVSEGRGQDLGLWVPRGPPADLGPGGTWVRGKCHLALVAVLPHVLLVTVTVLTFSASLGNGRMLVWGYRLGAARQSSTLPPGHFPNSPHSLPPTLSSAASPSSPSCKVSPHPRHCGLDLWVLSSCLLPILPTACQAPAPFHLPPNSAIDSPLHPHICRYSSGLTPSWTIAPASSPASWPPVCPLHAPPPSLFLHLAPPLPLLCSELSLGTLEAGDKFQGQPGGWTWAGHSHCRKSSSHTGTQAGSSRTPGHPADLWGQESSCEAG